MDTMEVGVVLEAEYEASERYHSRLIMIVMSS
jgi:hypothetical protein